MNKPVAHRLLTEFLGHSGAALVLQSANRYQIRPSTDCFCCILAVRIVVPSSISLELQDSYYFHSTVIYCNFDIPQQWRSYESRFDCREETVFVGDGPAVMNHILHPQPLALMSRLYYAYAYVCTRATPPPLPRAPCSFPRARAVIVHFET